jgi:hypothetical protein
MQNCLEGVGEVLKLFQEIAKNVIRDNKFDSL